MQIVEVLRDEQAIPTFAETSRLIELARERLGLARTLLSAMYQLLMEHESEHGILCARCARLEAIVRGAEAAILDHLLHCESSSRRDG